MDCLQNSRMRTLALVIDAEFVMNIGGAVEAYRNADAMSSQDVNEIIGKKQAIGLYMKPSIVRQLST